MQTFENVKIPLAKKDLIPINENTFPLIKSLANIKIPFSEIKEELEKQGLSINNLFHSSIGLYPFWYVDGYVFTPIPFLDKNSIEMYWKNNVIQQNKKIINNCLKKGDYESFFFYLESQFGFDTYFALYPEIPENQRYKIFIKLYVHNEYGFRDIDKEMIREIFSLNKDKSFIKELEVDSDGYVTIYRGMQEQSTPADEAYSWTLSIDVAKRFAVRHNSLECSIYQAKVKAEDIVDVLADRGEEEVLLLPENVVDIKNLGFYNMNDAMFQELHEYGIITQYQYYAHQELKGKWFHKPDGIHGKRHIKRVLFLSMIMSHLDDLSVEDRLILIYASLYHDIGRENDWEDEGHGMQSVLKRRQLKLSTDGLDEEEVKIMEFIMKYHSIRDEVGLKKINIEHGIKDKDRAIDLFKRFKDCDGLDRVRIGDLDGKYLRTETGRKLELLAYQLLRNIE